MDSFLQMNIFFFVSSVFSIIFGVLITIALIKILKILSRVENISEQASHEALLLKNDLESIRRKVSKEGMRIGYITGVVGTIIKHLKK